MSQPPHLNHPPFYQNIKIPYRKILDAYANFALALPVKRGEPELFDIFLGIDPEKLGQQYHASSDQWILPDDAGYKINMLLGPHYRTIVKIWLIQHEARTRSRNRP